MIKEIGIGYFGTGCTLWDKSTYENVGYISEAGNIKLYLSEKNYSNDVILKINSFAEYHKKAFNDKWDLYFNCWTAKLYEKIIDVLPHNDFMEHIKKKELSLEESCLELKELYFKYS